MKAYHFFDVAMFNLFSKETAVITPQQQQIGIDSKDLEPITMCELIQPNYYKRFQKILIQHEGVKRQRGRAYGEDLFFEKFVEDKSMNAYYNAEMRIY
ncbi:hypothetical protein [Paenibacillus apiarius]|uniref:hypothetical protein n=1 Tax=Paenibacillus apiarius TaxID=46240 RepID=UPI003B3AAC18